MSKFKVIANADEAKKLKHEELLNRVNQIRPIRGGHRISYHVKPRYAPGSPAMVDFGTAKRVAADEVFSHQATIEGIYGEESQKQAEARGLSGVVYAMDERADCWLVTDLITGESYARLFDRQFSTAGAKVTKVKHLTRKYGCDVREFDCL